MLPYYKHLLEEVWSTGRWVSPRGLHTRERVGLTVSFKAGELVTRKGFNRELAEEELRQTLGGYLDTDALMRVAPNAAHHWFRANWAYGPRVGYQLRAVVNRLSDDSDTRKAVILFGHPSDGSDLDGSPCLMSLQFLDRAGKLDAVATMRSWDLIHGLPYDMAVIGGLTMHVAADLGIAVGEVTVNAGSVHIYYTDQAKMEGARETKPLTRCCVEHDSSE